MAKKEPLSITHPELAKEWHPTKNDGLKSNEVTYSSQIKPWWICNKNHYWQALMHNRKNGANCPYCANQKVGFGNDLETNYPEIAKLWHPTKNGKLKPNMVTPGSNKKVWWMCEKKHEYISTPKSKRKIGKCPYCLNYIVGYGNDLMSKFPLIANQWHPTKNGNKKPENYVFGSEKSFWWVCDFGHNWKTSIKARTTIGTNCPKCSNQTSKIELYIFSELKSIFKNVKHRGKIDGLEIDILIEDLKLGIEYDGYHWHKNNVNRDKDKFRNLNNDTKIIRIREYPLKKINNTDLVIKYNENFQDMFITILNHIRTCFKKNNQIDRYIKLDKQQNLEFYELMLAGLPGPTFGNSLKDKYPQIALEWSSKNKLPPTKFTPHSKRKVWWECENKHEWEQVIGVRVKSLGCPYCPKKPSKRKKRKPSTQRIGYGNDLMSTHPEIAKEWHPKKNKIKPSEVSFGSASKIWWVCKKGHDYEQIIGARTGKKKLACPYCSGKKIGYGNDFASLYPKLAKEWHPTKNGDLKPYKIKHGSPKNVWWLCPNNHSYQRVVWQRTNLGYGCVFCSKRQTVLGYGNDLKSMFPAIAKKWHPTKNGELKPERVLSKSKQKAWFRCSKGHDFDQEIYYLTKKFSCPYCSGYRKK